MINFGKSGGSGSGGSGSGSDGGGSGSGWKIGASTSLSKTSRVSSNTKGSDARLNKKQTRPGSVPTATDAT